MSFSNALADEAPEILAFVVVDVVLLSKATKKYFQGKKKKKNKICVSLWFSHTHVCYT